MKLRAAFVLFCALAGGAGAARALDFVAVTDPAAILYDAPSDKGRKLYVVSRYTPLDVVVNLKDWIKVRDRAGTLAWIAKSAVSSSQRYVVVTAALADIRQAPDSSSALLLQARQQVALQWLEDTGAGWIKVRHRDGVLGYIKAAEVWGD